MCVDDYMFRHHSANRERICRRFIFQEEDKRDRIFLVNISQFQRFDDLCLCEILMHLNKKGLCIKDYQFCIEDLGIMIEAGDRCLVPFDSLTNKDVPIIMQKIQEKNDYTGIIPDISEESEALQVQNENIQVESSTNEQFLPNSNKVQNKTGKTKEREKNVGEALYMVKHWRWLHQKCNLSLKNAANIVGLSKKTLDDYYLVIRVGQLHCYDFKSNLEQKIGHLRSFIKNQKVKIKGRLCKVVLSFCLVPDPDVSNIIPIKDWSKVNEIHEYPSMSSLPDFIEVEGR